MQETDLAVTEATTLPEITNLEERIMIPVTDPEKNEQLLDVAVMLQERT